MAHRGKRKLCLSCGEEWAHEEDEGCRGCGYCTFCCEQLDFFDEHDLNEQALAEAADISWQEYEA